MNAINQNQGSHCIKDLAAKLHMTIKMDKTHHKTVIGTNPAMLAIKIAIRSKDLGPLK